MFTWCLGFVNQHNGHICKTLQRFHGLSHMWPLTPEYSNPSFECFFSFHLARHLYPLSLFCVNQPGFDRFSHAECLAFPWAGLSFLSATHDFHFTLRLLHVLYYSDCPTPVFKNYPEISGTSRVLSIISSVQGVRLQHHLALLAHPKCKRFWEV